MDIRWWNQDRTFKSKSIQLLGPTLCYFVARLREKWRKKCLISKIDAYLVDLPMLQVAIPIGRGRRLRPTIGPVGRGLLAPILVA